MILVCGATGTIGGQVIEQFAAAGLPVTALVRKRPEEGSKRPGVTYVVGDMADRESMASALQGVEKLFLVSANGEEQAELEENVIAAAAKGGVAHVVKLSVMGAALDARSGFGRLHARTENALQDSGMQWTILQPNMLMQNLRWYRGGMSQGVLPMPLRDAAVSHVDAGDVAGVAFHALTREGHAGRTYVLTGPEALTGTEVASTIAAATGRPIRYDSIPMAAFREYLGKNERSPQVLDAECDLFQAWSEGAGSAVTAAVEEVTGKKPVRLADFARKHAAELV